MPSQAYFESGGIGDVYDCVETTAPGETPITHPAKWRRVDIPAFLREAIVRKAASIVLAGEGQTDKARAEERQAEGVLESLAYRDAGETSTPSRATVLIR